MGERKSMETGARYAWGVLMLCVCLMLALSLFSYDWRDISMLRAPPNTPPQNLIGPVGAWLSFLLFMGVGVGAYLLPVWCLGMGILFFMTSEEKVWPRATWGSVTTLALIALFELFDSWWAPTCKKLNIVETSGLFGRLVTRDLLVQWLSPVGAGILLASLFVVSFVILVEMRNLIRAFEVLRGAVSPLARLAGSARAARSSLESEPAREEEEEPAEKRRRRALAVEKPERVRPEREPKVVEREPEPEPVPVKARRTVMPDPVPQPEPEAPVEPETPAVAAVQVEAPKKPPLPRKPKEEKKELTPMTAAPRPDGSPYELPPLSLLNEVAADQGRVIEADTGTTAKVLIETLAEFGIEAEVTNVEKGPVVTRYELLPAPGVRVEKIAALSNNLALGLKAHSVRVQAPVPGKGVVGIEVPNSTAKAVYLREVLEGAAWQTSKAKLPLVLGKDVGGNDLVADLAAMPHLLVAGATGSGKTVCMNSILAGLLMSRTPDQLRLLLVDPKIVEFTAYSNLPHLVVPVITNAKKVALGLRWAINEMEKRYKLFARVGVRNIDSFNSREIAKQPSLFGEESGLEPKPEDEVPARVPYIVIVVDELADLMLVDQAEIENGIARLAQLSRAVGIHMIIATQRPSVNVITGTIKANFPARMAFQVAQKTDSRTILDTNGAEKLLGRGDMLFLPPGTSKLVRAQGVMTTDEEIRKITEFIRNQAPPKFYPEIKDRIEKPTSKLEEGEDDDMITQAVEIIRETRRASTSSLQRRLRIGYTRAARMMDILEERGIVGPPRGSDAREILVDLDGEIENNAAAADAEAAAAPMPEDRA